MTSSWDCGDSTYSSTSEAELDSDQEDDSTDPQKLLNTWLGELESLKLGLDHVGVHAIGGNAGVLVRSGNSPVDRLALSAPRFDSYRFSKANLEESQDVELDAILGDLCVLESQFDKEIKQRGHARSISGVSSSLDQQACQRNSLPPVCTPLTPGSGGPPHLSGHIIGSHPKHMGHSRSSSGGSRPKFDIHAEVEPDDSMKNIMKSEYGLRTDSPDNDSAFSDNVSMLSSESSASSGGGGVAARTDVSSHHNLSSSIHSGLSIASSPTQLLDHISRRLQAIQVEVEKTNGPPLFIKAFSADSSAKSLLVDERMSVGHICHLLADKNHVAMDPKWALVEQIPELYMERIYEDHESLVENLLMWTRDSSNKLLFLERTQKYDLFISPENYLLGSSSSEKGADLDDDSKSVLLDEFFTISGVTVPEVEGSLYLKSEGKKAWKKFFFVLRASGLYYSPKGKSKLSKDLVCLTTFEMNNVYLGLNWRKKYKAPTDFGFAIKHPQIQTKSSKYIKYLCADDEWTLKHWVVGIRIAKYGRQLKENYDNLMRNMEEEDLDTLAHARSFSICSMAKTLQVSPDESISPESPMRELKHQSIGQHNDYLAVAQQLQLHQQQLFQQRRESLSDSLDSRNSTPTPAGLEHGRRHSMMSRQDSMKSSSSSGCMSERSSSGTPTGDPIAFDTDYPTGTIKRKPSMTPKIPLTSTTRSIAKQSVAEDNLSQVVQNDNTSSSYNLNGNVGSLGRSTVNRFSLRRSQTDDRIHVTGIFRNLAKQSAELAATKRSVGMVDKDLTDSECDDLPLPPPPMEMDSIMEGSNDFGLPPPPPEAFKGSTFSLDSLPPPPPPPKLEDEPSWPSTSSLGSLPPPPSPLNMSPPESEKSSPIVPPKPDKNRTQYRRLSETDIVLPPYLEELKQGQNGVSPPHTLRKATWRKGSADPSIACYGTNPRTSNSSSASPSSSSSSSSLQSSSTLSPSNSNSLSPKKGQHHSPTSPLASFPTFPQDATYDVKRKPRSQSKPTPPRRSNITQLTQTAAEANIAGGGIPKSPETFLKDLHRVMEKKWKVAQQLSNDHSATAHEILGFRDPCYLAPTENGAGCGPSGNTQFLDASSLAAANRLPQISPDDISRTFVISRKKAPPPPPRRSETTQLTRRQLSQASE